jgi:radical SAM superfamily enzyme YgiQ (UPF0313 family)
MFNIATPFPGTEMFDYAQKNHLLRTTDWARYDAYNEVMIVPGIREGELQRFYNTAFKEFYLRPSYLFGQLLKIRSLEDIRRMRAGLGALLTR